MFDHEAFEAYFRATESATHLYQVPFSHLKGIKMDRATTYVYSFINNKKNHVMFNHEAFEAYFMLLISHIFIPSPISQPKGIIKMDRQ
jgi:hypothetical protein